MQLTWTLYRLTLYAREGRRMRGRRVTVTVISVVVVVLAVACGPAEQAAPDAALEGQTAEQDAAAEELPHPGPVAPEEGPYDPDAQVRPDLMEVHPDPATPDGFVELRFPEETDRGVGFVLEQRVDDGWEVRYFLTSSEGREPSGPPEEPGGWWMPPDNPDRLEWPAVGVAGPVDYVLAPGPAAPGEYRICTANMDPNFCAELTLAR